MKESKCFIKEAYSTTGGDTYICSTHGSMWTENAFHVYPLYCPKAREEENIDWKM